jgi:hypothetical protein
MMRHEDCLACGAERSVTDGGRYCPRCRPEPSLAVRVKSTPSQGLSYLEYINRLGFMSDRPRLYVEILSIIEEDCKSCRPGEFGPNHFAGSACESRKRNHCTCDLCF